MRDWGEAMRLYNGPFGYHPAGRELMKAIAEIDKLRQDKAELVEDLNWLASLISEIIPENWGDYTLSGFVYPGIRNNEIPKLLEIAAKHGGEPK